MNENEFASSDEEMSEKEQTPFELSWLSLEPVNNAYVLGISCLPGCKFKNIQRNLVQDVEEIKRLGIQDVFLFCTTSELWYYRAPALIDEYRKQGFEVHHYPFLDGEVPDLHSCHQILEDLHTCIDNTRKTLIHSIILCTRSTRTWPTVMQHVEAPENRCPDDEAMTREKLLRSHHSTFTFTFSFLSECLVDGECSQVSFPVYWFLYEFMFLFFVIIN
ncbi:cyclin-dependent kinase inhibitor 3 isoform 1-T1 [Anomaloglossus baeobatrachus]|uniref:cyclin-dependent kinase inhibitor 3 isoform X2 n=1 Tax=Anomaloglossus baeobatrachus TaxID=238106 RepID=UPI003F507D66